MQNKTTDYLLNQKVKILQPKTGYRAAIDAVFLAASVQKVKKTDHILDVGAGTGAVSLCLAHHYPQNKITGWEIQPDLLNLAKESALLNGFQNVSYLEKDIKTAPRAANKVLYDHIVTNPPYFENSPASPDLCKSTANHMNHLSLNDWIDICLKNLKQFGWFYIIHRAEALQQILSALQNKTGNIKIRFLYSKKGQNAKRVIISAQKSAKAPLEVLPPFIIHTSSGTYTATAQNILRKGHLL